MEDGLKEEMAGRREKGRERRLKIGGRSN